MSASRRHRGLARHKPSRVDTSISARMASSRCLRRMPFTLPPRAGPYSATQPDVPARQANHPSVRVLNKAARIRRRQGTQPGAGNSHSLELAVSCATERAFRATPGGPESGAHPSLLRRSTNAENCPTPAVRGTRRDRLNWVGSCHSLSRADGTIGKMWVAQEPVCARGLRAQRPP